MLGTEDALFNTVKIPTIFMSLLKLAQKISKNMQRIYEQKICQHKKNAFASFEVTKILLI